MAISVAFQIVMGEWSWSVLRCKVVEDRSKESGGFVLTGTDLMILGYKLGGWTSLLIIQLSVQ